MEAVSFMAPSPMQTGIGGLDERLGGGLPAGSQVLIVSNSETAVRMFCQQVSFNLSQNGNRVLYLTLTKDPAYIREEMALYDWDTTLQEKKARWDFVDIYTSRVDSMLQRTDYSNFLGESDPLVCIRGRIIPEIKKRDVVVLDTLSDLLLRYETKSLVELLEAFGAVIRKSESIALLPIIDVMHDKNVTAILAHLADVAVELAINELSFEGKLRFWKMRKVRLEPFFLPFSMTTRGIVAETFRRIS